MNCMQCGHAKKLVGSLGVCHACYAREWRARRPVTACPGCRRPKRLLAKGLCNSCYDRRWKPRKAPDVVFLDEEFLGEIEFGDPRLPDRFWSKARPLDNGCWAWKSADAKGYGKFRAHPGFHGKERAHRVAYLALKGPVPEGLVLDHTCHNLDESCHEGDRCPHRRCVNPAHLEPATVDENFRRGRPSGRKPLPPPESGADALTCGRGHLQWGSNLYVSPKGRRKCRACDRDNAKRRYHARVKR
jgi:hypothetical protein